MFTTAVQSYWRVCCRLIEAWAEWLKANGPLVAGVSSDDFVCLEDDSLDEVDGLIYRLMRISHIYQVKSVDRRWLYDKMLDLVLCEDCLARCKMKREENESIESLRDLYLTVSR